ncbi:MAG TPA: MDR family MFS transporter [Candidatus Deferrimicrobiaceae bacterium]|nr:MDR family MFS transporter [Candidatus Deferrimicrobiaceae bacterium]
MASELDTQARRGLVLSGVMAAVFLAAMESTVVATAMPTVIASLGGIRIYSWTFSAFLLTSTVTMPIWGRLADQLGRRRAYLAGLALFLLGSALAGLSHSMEQLIAFRALQGLGAGSLISIGMTIVGDLYGVERRAKMQGYFSSVWGVASLVGPLVGGLLTDRVSWRWVFYINIPFGLLAAAAIASGLRDEGRDRPRASFDLPGTALFAAAISALLVGLVEIGAHEWWRPTGVGLLVLSGVLLVVFVLVERRVAEPVIPLRLFGNPVLRAAAVTGLLSGMAMFGAITYVPLYLQAVTGSTATQAGWVLMPFVLGWVVFSVVGARLVLRVGYRRVVLVGMSALVLAFVLLAGWDESLTRMVAARDVALAGVGMGLIFVPMLIAVQNSVPRSRLGSATSLTGFFRTVGGAVGVTVMGAAMTHRLERALATVLTTAPADLQEPLRWLAAHPDLAVNPITRATLGEPLLVQMRPVLAHAVGGVFVVGLVIAVAALLSAFLVPAGQVRDLADGRESPAPSKTKA